jgi:hypothetical protein
VDNPIEKHLKYILFCKKSLNNNPEMAGHGWRGVVFFKLNKSDNYASIMDIIGIHLPDFAGIPIGRASAAECGGKSNHSDIGAGNTMLSPGGLCLLVRLLGAR